MLCHWPRPKILLYITVLITVFYLFSCLFSEPELDDSQSSSTARSKPARPRFGLPSIPQLRVQHAPPPRPVRPSQADRQTAARLFPYKSGEGLWRQKNQETFARLLACQRNIRGCAEKDAEIVLLGTVHFSRVTQGVFSKKAEFPVGEAIWADALLWALDQLGFPYLVIDGDSHDKTNTLLGDVYALIGDNVKMVLGDYLSIPKCLKNTRCALSQHNPGGIPHHKLFVFDGFGQDVGHPLGRRWHLTFYPQEEKNFTYLGLTIEHQCHRFGVVPARERSKKIYVLGKDRSYLHPPAPTLYPETMWREVTNKTGVGFTIGTVQKDRVQRPDMPDKETDRLLDGLDDIGTLSRDDFMKQIQRHIAVIGLGWPPQPSTPLEALCVGTPFINPVWVGRRSQPDRSKWHTQHPYLARFDPPYVYNVQDRRVDDVMEAVEGILKSPLTEAFVPEDMKKEAYLKRIEGLIRFDWNGLAQELEG